VTSETSLGRTKLTWRFLQRYSVRKQLSAINEQAENPKGFLRSKTHFTIELRTNEKDNKVPWLLRPIHLRLFIWDYSFETTTFETTFIWDHVHLRPRSFETTFIWDHVHYRFFHLRPHSFETTFVWDHIHLRPHSFETTIFETTISETTIFETTIF